MLPLAAPVHFRKGMRDKDEDKKRLVCIIYRSIDDYVLHYSNHSVFTGMGYSLVSWDGLAKSEKVFVGLSNYAKIFSDKQFLTSLVRTTLFTLITVVIVNVLALAFAVLVTTKLKVRNVARTMLFLPYLLVD